MTEAGAITMQTGRRGFTVAHAAVVSIALWTVALLTIHALAHGPWRAGLMVGVCTAVLSGIGGLTAVALTEGRKLNAVLLGRVTSFLGRILLLAAGLVITVRTFHAEPLGFALAFFSLFFASTLLEQIVWMVGRTGEAPVVTTTGGAR